MATLKKKSVFSFFSALNFFILFVVPNVSTSARLTNRCAFFDPGFKIKTNKIHLCFCHTQSHILFSFQITTKNMHNQATFLFLKKKKLNSENDLSGFFKI